MSSFNSFDTAPKPEQLWLRVASQPFAGKIHPYGLVAKCHHILDKSGM